MRRRDPPHRVVVSVEQPGRHWGGVRHVLEPGDDPVAVGQVRVALEELLLPFDGDRQALAGTGQVGQVDEAVVLAEAQEYRAQHPGHRGLGDLAVQPRLIGGRGPLGRVGLLPFRPQCRGELRHLLGALAQVGLERADLGLEVGQQGSLVDHEALRSRETGQAGEG